MSKINGEKARSAVEAKKRTAQRAKMRELRQQHMEKHGLNEKTLIQTVRESKPVAKVAKTVKKAGDALAELAELAKPKRKKKEDTAS